MSITRHEVRQVVEETWEGLLGLPVAEDETVALE